MTPNRILSRLAVNESRQHHQHRSFLTTESDERRKRGVNLRVDVEHIGAGDDDAHPKRPPSVGNLSQNHQSSSWLISFLQMDLCRTSSGVHWKQLTFGMM
jgi:hypothetical protein